MKVPVTAVNLADLACSASRRACPRLLPAVFAGMLLLTAHPAAAALSFGRGSPSTVGCIKFANSPDSVTITAALTGPGTITGGLAIPANRIQYDIINCDVGPMFTWTVYYAPAVGPDIIGVFTPLGYIDLGGVIVPQGGVAYTTLFNVGYGVYNYNTGAPWIIDYEPDHITFSTTAAPPGLPANAGVGYLNPTYYLPSFAILFSPSLANGLVPASAQIGSVTMNGQVLGPLPGNPCLSIQCSNIVVETCSNCVPVTYSATALDTCCPNVNLIYQPPSGTCFPVNKTTTVTVIATDNCNNNGVTNYFTVTVNPGPNCNPTNCITIYSSNIVAHTCAPCTPVVYNTFAVDNCCVGAPPTLIFNPPPGTCFPLGPTTVNVTAYDQCGNTNTGTFTVTVKPGPDCGNTNCISINATDIVAYTCSPCTTVPFNVTAFDQCCTAGGLTISYNPPTNTCFPPNSLTTVQIKASDTCGNSATKFITVKVVPGPNCIPTNCITIYSSNIVVYTCGPCTNVSYNASVLDTCCAAGATLSFNPPETYCFPLGSTKVNVSASDQCGNGAVSSFTVTVLQGPNCNPTNCITIYSSNIVVYTCGPCTNVSYNASVLDPCCATGATLSFNPPETYCFPLGSTTVNVSASDQCGNGAVSSFTVTVLQASGCGPTNCISIYCSNIVVYTCSNCVTVPYNAFAVDSCCPVDPNVTLTYDPPASTCFPLPSSTQVQVVGSDACGNKGTNYFTVTVLPGTNCGGSNPLGITGKTGPGGGTNLITVWWPAPKAQLLESAEMIEWHPVPGATNSPYVVPNQGHMKFFRLQYK
jgi:hypothetical protein